MFGPDYVLPLTEVKARRRTPDSLELTPALNLGEQGNDSRLHSGEWLRWEFVRGCPRV
jgi:hypothetical protein